MVSNAILALLLIASGAEAGVSFVRWGRTKCPDGTISLYKGYMGGAHWTSGGSGARYVCMHEDPKFVRPVPGRQPAVAMIYGVEYDRYFDGLPFKTDNLPGGTLLDQDMPCVLCYVQDSTDKFMLPGRPDCGTTGYQLMYSGFLVSEFDDGARKRGDLVCLDESPEGRVGGTGNDNQGVLSVVQVGCGSLPCNPYVDGYEATCAICVY